MQPNEYPVHRTFTRQMLESEGGGYEFWCADCSYRVGYLENKHSSIGPLVHILDAGNPGVWHTSSQIIPKEPKDALDSSPQTGAADAPADDQLLQEDDITSDTWVTPEISAFLERILAGLD